MSVDAERATGIARQVLRRKFFRVSISDGEIAAEKGIARELGSLLFHWAFLLIVIGAVYGKGTGYSGKAAIIEGETWTDSLAAYDGVIRTGRFFDGRFSGAQIHLNDFEDTFRASGIPMDFVSRVDLLNPDGSPAGSADIRVNHPATFDGIRVFQYGFGWAPVVEVRSGETVLWSGPIGFSQDTAPPGVPQLALPWHGVLKLPSLAPQMGVTLELWPDANAFLQMQLTGQPIAMVIPNDPIIRFTTYRGPLTDPSPRSLDTTIMQQQAQGFVGQGQVVDLATGKALAQGSTPKSSQITISFPQLKQYSVFQVSRDPGVWIVLLAAILVLVGLLPALYTSRRKIWVRVEPAEGGSVVKVGGFALQRKEQFAEETARLVRDLERAIGGKVEP